MANFFRLVQVQKLTNVCILPIYVSHYSLIGLVTMMVKLLYWVDMNQLTDFIFFSLSNQISKVICRGESELNWLKLEFIFDLNKLTLR